MKTIVVLALLLFSAPLFAQNDPTIYDFEPDKVEGGIVKPFGDGVTSVPHGKTSSLIQIRSDFVDVLVASVDDI